jgi:hypothetical protein
MPRRSPRAARLMIVTLVMTIAVSAPSNTAFAVDLFQDDFETGNLSAWTTTNSFTAQSAITHAGSWAGRATATSGPAFASKTISGQTDVYLRSFVRVVSHGGANQILRMGSSTGAGSTISLILLNSNQLQVKNHVAAGEVRNTGVTLVPGTWVDLQLHLHIGGANGLAELWVNGVQAGGLSGAWNFGTTPIDSVVLGAQAPSGPAMDVAYDDVKAATTFIGGGGGPTIPPTPTGLTPTGVFHDHVDLTWNPSSGATGYTVYRAGTFLATTTSTSFTDGTVDPETTYLYSVDAFNDAGHSAPSNQISVTTPAEPSGGGIVVRAAGDIACDPADPAYNGGNGTSTKCRQKHTAQLLSGADRVFAIGDAQYNCGGLSAFNTAYNPTWGVYKNITHPILSDEDYDTSGTGCGAAGADGYFSYFNSQLVAQPGNTAEDPTKGYYSFDVGTWHVIALNSECVRIPGGCGEGGAQNNWLEADLAASTAQCTMALLHAPLFTSKSPDGTVDGSVRPLVQDLYDAGAEMFLSGDKHFYERFRPQDPQGNADPNGIVQWVIGVGGKSLNKLSTFRRPNSATANSSTFGVLELTLNTGSYGWDFIVEGSSTYRDSGSASCH